MKNSALLVYLLIMCITPGPNNLTALYLGAEYGLRGAGKFIAESNTALFIKALLCGFLNLALAAVLPSWMPYLKWVGAAYMLWLGWGMLRSGFTPDEKEDGAKRGKTYPSGILLQCLNFKSWIVCLSIFSVYVIPYTQKLSAIVLVSAVFVGLALAATYIWCGCGKILDSVYRRFRKPCSVLLALSLVYCAVTALM